MTRDRHIEHIGGVCSDHIHIIQQVLYLHHKYAIIATSNSRMWFAFF